MHEESVDGQAQPSVRTDGQAWQRLCAGRLLQLAAEKEQKASALSNLNFEGRDFGADREQRLQWE